MQRQQRHLGFSLDGALRHDGARLWLDGRPRGAIAWAGRPGVRMRRRGRLICSAELAALLPRGASPLALPFHRPLALGRQTVTLAPAGSGPGSSILYLTDLDRRVAVATAARAEALAGAGGCELERCDVIIVDARYAADAEIPLSALAEALATLCADGGEKVVVCDDFAVALTVAQRVPASHEARLGAGFEALLRQWRNAGHGADVPAAARARTKRRPRCHITSPRAARRVDASYARLWLAGRGDGVPAASAAVVGTAGREAEVELAAQLGSAAEAPASLAFGWQPRGVEVDRLVAASGAREVIAIGAGADALAARMAKDGRRVVVLHDDLQLKLL